MTFPVENCLTIVIQVNKTNLVQNNMTNLDKSQSCYPCLINWRHNQVNMMKHSFLVPKRLWYALQSIVFNWVRKNPQKSSFRLTSMKVWPTAVFVLPWFWRISRIIQDGGWCWTTGLTIVEISRVILNNIRLVYLDYHRNTVCY